MSRISALFVVAIVQVFLLSSPGSATPQAADLPKAGGKPVLARLNGEPLLLEEFERVLAGIHDGGHDNTARSMPKPSLLLERLINARLVLQEARNIGLDALPEVQTEQKVFEEETLRAMLYERHVRNIRKPDRKAVEALYRDAVKEVKIQSVLFDKEENANRVAAEAGAGGGFEGPAKRAIDAGEAKGNVEGQYLKFSSLGPDAAKAVSSMKPGGVSPVIRTGKTFYLLKLEKVRYPKDPAARRQAEEDALQEKRSDALRAYLGALRKKYAKIDRELLDSLDFESADPGIGKLRSDERTLARVKGDKPVTVEELTVALEKRFFHGAERASEKKKVNAVKHEVFEGILNKRVALLEAKGRKLERTEFFRLKAQENRDRVLFVMFLQKVIAPDVKVSEEEVEAFYREHIGEYMAPEMVRIEGLAFAKKGDAEDAIERLRKGADFQWLRANADGQIDPAKEKDLPEFKGRVLALATLPDGVRKALSGAGTGEYRLHDESGKAHYVLHLLERISSMPIPLESVKEQVKKRAVSEKAQSTLRDWEEKLRKASDVKIYATGKKLNRLVNPGAR